MFDHGNQQNPPSSKLHIELLKQFEGSKTFTNCIKPLLPKKRIEQPGLIILYYVYYRSVTSEARSMNQVFWQVLDDVGFSLPNVLFIFHKRIHLNLYTYTSIHARVHVPKPLPW